MAVKISKIAVDLPGQVIRRFDKTTEVTTLVVDDEQVRSLYEQLSPVLAFFDSQGNGERADPVEVKFSG